MQAILISRFILNLRRSQKPPPLESRPSRFSMSQFHLPTMSAIVGDMGQPLNHGMDADQAHTELADAGEVDRPGDGRLKASARV